MTRLRDLVRAPPRRGIELPGWIERMASIGIVTSDPEVARRQRFTNVAAYAIAANAGSHLLVNFVYEPRRLAIIHAYNIVMTLAMLLIHRLHRFGDHVAATTLLCLGIGGNLFVVWMLGRASDLHVYFTLAGATIFMFGVENWRYYVPFFLLTGAALIAAVQSAPPTGLIMSEDATLRDMLSGQAMMNTIVINGLMIFYSLAALRRAEFELDQQYARSEALIRTVMPHSIAERLKSGTEQRIADRIDNLTVLFADLVDFTAAARGLPPETVVEYLDDLVRTFDALCEQHGVEKIKTIGDSYMAVGGLYGENIKGAIAVGRLALAMLAANADRPPLAGRRLALRIGIHCGPATAGVIGETRISYDVWGDAVNTASRMESHGVPGRIHVSAAYRELTCPAFLFEERGATDIRGLGATRTFFLLGPR
jgi:adenylate cyclase